MNSRMVLVPLIGGLLLVGCMKYTLEAKVYDGLPNPLIRIEQQMRVTILDVTRVRRESGESKDQLVWLIVAKDERSPPYLNAIRYGVVPEGHKEAIKAAKLELGYYSIDIVWSPGPVSAGGDFIVANDKDGGRVILNVRIERDFIGFHRCLNQNRFDKDKILSHCQGEGWTVPR